MKRLILLLAAAVSCVTSYAQGVRYDNNAWTAATNVPTGKQAPMYTVPYASVTVCTDSSCAGIVPVYNNKAMTGSPQTQPLQADAFGRYGFWAAAGTYWVKACSSGNQCKSNYVNLGSTGTGTGSVTSVGLTLPGLFTVTGSPVTSSGTLAASLASQSANSVFAGPSSGSSAAPTFRALTLADLPAPFTLTTTGTSGAATYSGGVLNIPNYATGGGGGSGTVTSVGLTLPSIFGVSGSPVTVSGTLAASLATQTAHSFFAGPGTGTALAPTFRSIIPGDLPVATTSSLGAVQPDGTTITISGGVISSTGGSGGGVSSINSTAGAFTFSGSGVSCTGTTCTFSGGSGSSGITGLTAGYIPLAGSSTTLTANSHLDDGVTTASTITSSEPIAIATASGQGGAFSATEGTAVTAAAGKDILYADSTAHCLEYSANGGSFSCLGAGGGGMVYPAAGIPLSTGTAWGSSFSIVPVAYGGTGTATPGIVAGSNVTVTGTWPNQTVASSGGGTTAGTWSRQGTTLTGGANNQHAVQEPTLIYNSSGSPAFWEEFATCGWTTAGLCYWTGSDPVNLTPQNNGNAVIAGVYHGKVKKIAGTYYYMGVAYGTSATSYVLYSSTTPGSSWTLVHSGLIPAIGGTSWDVSQKGNIDWWVDGSGVWQVLYEALGSDTIWRVGRATATATGVPTAFTAFSGNPVISWGGFTGASWASGGMCGGARSTALISGAYYTWLQCDSLGGSGATGTQPTDIYRWKSTDSSQDVWTLDTTSPALPRTTSDEGPSNTAGTPGQVADASMVEVNGTVYMAYDATDTQSPVSGDGIHVKLATAPMTLANLVTTQEGNGPQLGMPLVANAHLGTGAVCWSQTQTLGSAAASITFSNISSCGNRLRLSCTGRDDSAAVSVTLQMNGDTAAHYQHQVISSNATTTTSGGTVAETSVPIATDPGPAAPSGQAGVGITEIEGYANTAFLKNYVSRNFRMDSTVGGGLNYNDYGGSWQSTAAIHQLTISASSGNFIAGSFCTAQALY